MFALYRKTWMCPLWIMEKKWYSGATLSRQKLARKIYLLLFRLRLLMTGQSLSRYVAAYNTRGMDYYHDVHDWLGGYPYESILPESVDTMMQGMGLFRVRSFPVTSKRKPCGVFGTGCDEYVFGKS